MAEENLTPDGDGEPFSYDPLANPRHSVEDEMAAKRRKELQDLPTLDGLNEQADFDPLAPEDDNSQGQQAEPEGENPPRDDQGRFAPKDSKPEEHESSSGETRKLRLKVDGREEELTEAEVIALAQKGRAADARFQDAAAMMRQAQELARQYQSAQQPPQPAAKPSTPATGDDDLLVKALMYGSPEEVHQAIAELRKPQQPTIDPGQVAVMAAEMATDRSEYQMALNSALNEFPEVKTDQRLQEVATSFVMDELAADLKRLGYTEQQLMASPREQWWQRHREARKAGYSMRGYQDLFISAGQRTREWRSGGQQPAKPDGLAEKADRKAMQAPQPRAAHAATPVRQPAKPPTQAQLIAEERKQRGLA